MPFLNFGGNKISIVICPTWISLWKIWKIGSRIQLRIHFEPGYGSTFSNWIRGSGSTITERWIRGSGSTFPKRGSQDPDPDPRQNEMDPKRCISQSIWNFPQNLWHYLELEWSVRATETRFRNNCFRFAEGTQQGFPMSIIPKIISEYWK